MPAPSYSACKYANGMYKDRELEADPDPSATHPEQGTYECAALPSVYSQVWRSGNTAHGARMWLRMAHCLLSGAFPTLQHTIRKST